MYSNLTFPPFPYIMFNEFRQLFILVSRSHLQACNCVSELLPTLIKIRDTLSCYLSVSRIFGFIDTIFNIKKEKGRCQMRNIVSGIVLVIL